MAAALLAKGTVTLHRIPRITDVSVMWSLLEALGARIRSKGDNTSRSTPATSRPIARPTRWCASSPLRSISSDRCWDASGAPRCRLPGGCVLGTRATDMHEQAFVALGCDVHNAHGYLIAQARGSRLVGARHRVSHAQRRRDQERDARRRPRRRNDDDQERRDGTRGRRPCRLSRRDGREDRRPRNRHGRRSRALKNCTASNTRSFRTES